MTQLIAKSVQWCFVLVLAASITASCSKDDDAPWLSLDSDAIIVTAPGEAGSVQFTASGIQSVSVTDIPQGWTITADMSTMTLTAQSSASIGGAGIATGTATVNGHTTAGGIVTQKLFVSVALSSDLSGVQSNCFVVSAPNTNYSFDAQIKGENAGRIDTHDVRIIWQTETELIRFLKLNNGKCSFYVAATDGGGIREGNVLLGAYDANGALLWTWHIWIVDADDVREQSYANGKTFLSLNLGALGNTNATTDEILASFGLFYQWGRRTPFVGPNTYDAAKGTDRTMYSSNGERITLEYVPSDAATGTQEFAATHPMSFILGVAESSYDWLYTSHSERLWSSTKTENDPCPKGWRVPSKEDFAGLGIVDKAAGTVSMYGWYLTDGTVTAYYPAAGFRTYRTGKIQNVYNPLSGVEVPKPWMGYYWTAGTEGTNSSAMTFWLDAANAAQSGIEPSSPFYRADGMQIRCVKE